jgi:hypothetical protein
LLQRGIVDPALAGDLVEEHASGRSSSWFWRQVLTAIAIAAARDIRTHKTIAILGAALGFASMVLFGSLLHLTWGILSALTGGGIRFGELSLELPPRWAKLYPWNGYYPPWFYGFIFGYLRDVTWWIGAAATARLLGRFFVLIERRRCSRSSPPR